MIAKDRVGPTMSQGSLSRDELGGINMANRHSIPQRKCVKEQKQERKKVEKNKVKGVEKEGNQNEAKVVT